MQRSTERILTTHVGSLIRPKTILEYMKARELGAEYDQAAFDAAVRQAVTDVVKQQVETGIDIPNDGEFARSGYTRYINDRLEGFEPRDLEPGERVWSSNPDRVRFPDFYAQYDSHYRKLWMHPDVPIDDLPNVPGNFERFRVTGQIKYRGQAAIQEEIANLKAALSGLTVTEAFIPATHSASRLGDRDVLKFYPSVEAYMYAVADAFSEEYRAIVDSGFLLQVDYPNVTSASWFLSSKPAAEREEILRAANLGVEVLNHALRDIPEDRVRLHYCWGSMNEPHTRDTPLQEVLPLIFKIKAQAYSIEAANPRHEHEWQVWKDVKLPEGKILIPGIISHQTNVVEHPELVSWRIKNFAGVIGKENVIAGADCGFSQFWDSIRVHPQVQWAKLEALVEGARLASRDLWS